MKTIQDMHDEHRAKLLKLDPDKRAEALVRNGQVGQNTSDNIENSDWTRIAAKSKLYSDNKPAARERAWPHWLHQLSRLYRYQFVDGPHPLSGAPNSKES